MQQIKMKNKVYSVFDKENLEYITDITEDELFEVVAKRGQRFLRQRYGFAEQNYSIKYITDKFNATS